MNRDAIGSDGPEGQTMRNADRRQTTAAGQKQVRCAQGAANPTQIPRITTRNMLHALVMGPKVASKAQNDAKSVALRRGSALRRRTRTPKPTTRGESTDE